LLSEMESFCDRVGVLSSGRLVACGTPAEITQTRDEVAVQIAQNERDEVLTREVTAWGGSVEALEGDQSRVLVPPERVYGLLGLLEKRRARLIAVTPQRETLEEAFLRLVG
jgi:ABC-type multidrug transport system ATPase subunit